MTHARTPVLVGVGQVVSHWDASAGAQGAPSYLSLAIEAAQRAIDDTGAKPGLAEAIDTAVMVRTMADSVPSFDQAFGQCNNLPRAVAEGIGAKPRTAIYSAVGGQSPQSLVNEMADRIYDGEDDVVLIAGSEALGAMKSARRAGVELDWSHEVDGDFEDRGLGPMLLSRTEIKHGMVVPAYFYALFETAYAHKKEQSRSTQIEAMSQLFARFSDVAAHNPYAQFQTSRSAEFLSTPSKENYPFADPYLKWHMAQDAVNMAAGVILMSSEKADELGIDPAKRVYLHGAGEAHDDFISERPELAGSWAMRTALGRALEQSGKEARDMAMFDLYSCFPIAVFSSTQAMGIDWKKEKRPLTLTGGLPFFGGPGNNYSLHGIASMVDVLRGQPGAYGLVLANGGWMTKEAAGVYSTEPCAAYKRAEPAATPDARVEIETEPTSGVLETFTVVNGRKGPGQAICFGRTEAGKRFVAMSQDEAVIARLKADDFPIGAVIKVSSQAEVNTFEFA